MTNSLRLLAILVFLSGAQAHAWDGPLLRCKASAPAASGLRLEDLRVPLPASWPDHGHAAAPLQVSLRKSGRAPQILQIDGDFVVDEIHFETVYVGNWGRYAAYRLELTYTKSVGFSHFSEGEFLIRESGDRFQVSCELMPSGAELPPFAK